MAADRLLRILGYLARAAGERATPADLVAVARDVLGMSGAGILLMPQGSTSVSLCTTDAVSALLHQLETDLGEGPSVDAHRLETPVLEPDLLAPVTPRWLSFASAAGASGVRALASAPLQLGAVRLGVLSLWGDQPGALSDDEHADLLTLADVATRLVLDLHSAENGVAGLEDRDHLGFQDVVHQAAGMVSVQLGASLEVALVRLRASAYASDLPVRQVAAEVVARRLRFEPDPPNGDPYA